MLPTVVSNVTVSKPRSEGDAVSHLRSNELISVSFFKGWAEALELQQKVRRDILIKQMPRSKGMHLAVFSFLPDLLFI
jgi:hypothetical protein